MASYTHIYKPRIQKTTTDYLELDPYYLPLEVRDYSYSNRIAMTQVPLQDGAVVYDVRRGPLTLSIQGKLNGFTSVEDMLVKQDSLHTYLCGGTTTPTSFTFFTYYDATNGNYRWFKGCYSQDLQFHHSSRTKLYLPYSFTVVVPDGIEWEKTDAAATPDPDDPFVSVGLYGPRVVRLSDNAGATGFVVINSDGDIVFKVDSQGNVTYTGVLLQVSSITPITE